MNATPTTRAAPDLEGRGSPRVSARRPVPGKGGIRLGRWLGIEIRLETSWFFIFAFLILSFAASLAAAHPDLAPVTRWAAAAGTSLVFFGSILLHEMAHSVVARRMGIPVHGITLLLFGGVSHLACEPRRPREDLAIAAVGPLTSAILGALFIAMSWVLGSYPVAKSVTLWLGIINLGLAAFNLLPGFPLDGGRILKALLWTATGDAGRAHRMAATAGQVLALGMILFGVVLAFEFHRTVDGLWIGFMGWYLYSGAQSNRLQHALSEVLKSHQVQDVVRPPEAFVRAGEPLGEVIEEWVLRKGHRTLLVCQNDRLLGLVTLHEIKRIPREDWGGRTVGQVMIPAEQLATVEPRETLLTAFQRMDEHGVSRLPVVAEGALVGTVGREDILRLLAVHAELGKPAGDRR